MRVLFLSVEVEPFAKVGGLADVAGSLPRALASLGHDVRTVLPAYGMALRNPKWDAERVLSQIPVTLNPRLTVLADLYQVDHEGSTVWLIDGDGLFRDVAKSEDVYSPNRDAYLFFAQAALDLCKAQGWIPDVVHANDWHTAFAPVFLREREGWEQTASVLTVHNLAYQGQFGADTVEAAGLPMSSFDMHRLETWGGVNFLKSGLVYADQANTVSPTYAREAETEEFGCGLWGLVRHLALEGKWRGILNGIDTAHHDPSTDPRVPHHFSASDLTGKAQCRAALCHELGLDVEARTPVLAVISRLSSQKGFDLIAGAFEKILGLDTVVVVQALGDPVLAERFRALQQAHPTRLRFIEAFDADMAQRVYAGSDAFLMPSAFEPCGLGQMFAMRYGTVPVVRQTGGLADTVHEGVNGFVFQRRDADEFLSAVERAVTAFREPERWRRLVLAGMTADFSWAKSAQEYERLYQDALSARKAEKAAHGERAQAP